MHHQAYYLTGDLRTLQRTLDRTHEADGRINGSGRDFNDDDLARGLIYKRAIGEGAADIDA
jgi:hypothetical protein